MGVGMMKRQMLRRLLAGVLVAGGLGWTAADAIENPTSYGPVARIDTPILRVPFMHNPPTIDGVMEDGEWEDASALSGFWYDFAQAHFYFMAPHQTQLQVYAGYDREHLYFAYSSPVYPESSWLRARGRFPDVTHDPRYGLIWDDHIELELRPHHDNAEGFRLGLFKWFANPFDTIADLYWSPTEPNPNRWQSGATIRSHVTAQRWTMEIKIPLENMVFGNYDATKRDGSPIVTLPPPDGTAYRAWFIRGIGGQGTFFNAFDNHSWNTTKTMLIFDSTAPVIQINELGPIMDDIVDLRMTLKNHNTRSETVRLGFFIESQEGMIYSSYDAPELNNGLVELRPGETRQIRLRRPFPGISRDGNTLWFDVRSAGRPYKILLQTRLIDFHSMDGGTIRDPSNEYDITFRERRIDAIEHLRPPRRDFDFDYEYSSYRKTVQGIVDIGIHGASDEARRATEAKLSVMRHDDTAAVIAEQTVPIHGDFGVIVLDVPDFEPGEEYRVSLLLFDEHQRIVGERNPEPFEFETYHWQNNDVGLSDTVWEPFTPIEQTADGFETLKHRFTLDGSGLPAQIFIKPDVRDLPLEARAGGALSDDDLIALGRGPQLRGPVRLIARVDGREIPAEVVTPAEPIRVWQSEIEYRAVLQAGPLNIELFTQYDCDGAMHSRIVYGSSAPVTVEGFEMLMDVAGLVDLATSGIAPGMVGAEPWECGLPMREGVIWDSADIGTPDMYYSQFMPWFWFGSGDRGFTFYSDSDAGWILDRHGSAMQLERNADGAVTWRTIFVNHSAEVAGEREIAFTLLTHPAKSKPENFREKAWFWRGGNWADEYFGGDFTKSEEALLTKARAMMTYCDGIPREEITPEKIASWTPDGPLYWRYYQNKGLGNVPRPRHWDATDEEIDRMRWDELSRPGNRNDQFFEDKIAYFFERHVRIGRRHGWWWDETWPGGSGWGRSDSLAEGHAYLREPETVGPNEVPWQAGFLTGHMRNAFKRLARVFAENDMPNRNFFWANTEATTFESLGFDAMLVEECGGGHRSFDVDMLQQFPNSAWRRMAHNYSGLVVRIAPESAIGIHYGDDPRLSRSYPGIAMLHDIGTGMAGPHGQLEEKQEAIRAIQILRRFGYFEADDQTEMIPFWRTGHILGFDESQQSAREATILDALQGDPEITVYRRPLTDGRNGVKALIVILNERDHAIELPLELRDVERLLGGPNTLSDAAALEQTEVPDALADWWDGLVARRADSTAVLMDLETGDAIPAVDADGLRYGPVFVPYHTYRLLYAEHVHAE